MLISHRYRFVFVHIYKTGGSSINAALAPYARLRDRLVYGDGPARRLVGVWNRVTRSVGDGNRLFTGLHMHSTASEARGVLGKDIFDSYFSFAFVRDPYDWVVSTFEYIRRNQAHELWRQVSSMSFEEFVEFLVRTEMPSQTKFVTDLDGNVIVDYVGRMENLEGDFELVTTRIGLKSLAIPHRNRGKRGKVAEYYNDRSVMAVSKYLSEDFANFGYERRD